MTADERIEGLLNAFGQTIADLPKADGDHHVYDVDHRHSARETVYKWHHAETVYVEIFDLLEMHCSYICHLCDVIDRMETALATARRMMGCRGCKDYGGIFGRACKKFNREGACFVVDDAFLMGGDD